MSVNLSKGQQVSLTKTDGGSLAVVRMVWAGRPRPAKASSPNSPPAHRSGSGWQMAAIGAPASGRTFQDLMPAIATHL